MPRSAAKIDSKYCIAVDTFCIRVSGCQSILSADWVKLHVSMLCCAVIQGLSRLTCCERGCLCGVQTQKGMLSACSAGSPAGPVIFAYRRQSGLLPTFGSAVTEHAMPLLGVVWSKASSKDSTPSIMIDLVICAASCPILAVLHST